MTIEIGIASLSDRQHRTVDGRTIEAPDRLKQIVALAVLADELGLDHFGLGEHHSEDFVVSSPAVALAAIAARTSRIRLTSAVTVLSVLDPVRVYQDYATVDVLSGGRVELIVGRSAFAEPFALFGVAVEDYDRRFAQSLDLLLAVRAAERVTWTGGFRPGVHDAFVGPRAVQAELPVWLGVGGTPASADRAGRLGLPMVIGYIGGSVANLQALAHVYRVAGERAGHADRLQLSVALHLLIAETGEDAAAAYPHYRDFLRPKRPGGTGFLVSPEQFAAGIAPRGHLMFGPSDYVTEKLLALDQALGLDRIQALVDWGGLPPILVEESIDRLAREVAPVLRAEHVAAPAPI